MDAGTYTVWYRTYLSDAPDNISVTIAPLDINGAEIVLWPSPVYNGKEQVQHVESVMVEGLFVTYVVSGNSATEVGEYTLTITGSGNFCGTVECVWELVESTSPEDKEHKPNDRPIPDHDRKPGEKPDHDRIPKEKGKRGEGRNAPREDKENSEKENRNHRHNSKNKPGEEKVASRLLKMRLS